jgi:hypothetical protein
MRMEVANPRKLAGKIIENSDERVEGESLR